MIIFWGSFQDLVDQRELSFVVFGDTEYEISEVPELEVLLIILQQLGTVLILVLDGGFSGLINLLLGDPDGVVGLSKRHQLLNHLVEFICKLSSFDVLLDVHVELVVWVIVTVQCSG